MVDTLVMNNQRPPEASDSGVASAPNVPPLQEGEVQVWTARLCPEAADLAEMHSILDHKEQERAARFHFDVHRDRFIAARVMLRWLLAGYTGAPAQSLQFHEGPFGKPSLASAAGRADIQFNVSHCEDVALFAFRLHECVGIDLERVRELQDADELVNRFFSRRENLEYQHLEPALKPQAFFNLWTRKEAFLKATGEGIGERLNQVEVTFLPGEPAGILGLPADLQADGQWLIEEITPVPGFCGAVVTRPPVTHIKTLHWPGFHHWTQL
jgi:4'-phosphopantetheinyl transferase